VPWRGVHESPRGRHGCACERESRAYACDGRRKVDKCASFVLSRAWAENPLLKQSVALTSNSIASLWITLGPQGMMLRSALLPPSLGRWTLEEQTQDGSFLASLPRPSRKRASCAAVYDLDPAFAGRRPAYHRRRIVPHRAQSLRPAMDQGPLPDAHRDAGRRTTRQTGESLRCAGR